MFLGVKPLEVFFFFFLSFGNEFQLIFSMFILIFLHQIRICKNLFNVFTFFNVAAWIALEVFSEWGEWIPPHAGILFAFFYTKFLTFNFKFILYDRIWFLSHWVFKFCLSQAIQNQLEMDTLRKKLEFCMEEKEKFER